MGAGAPNDGKSRKKAQRERAWRARRRESAAGPHSLREALLGLLERMGGTPERAGLQSLWDNWETVLGPELAALAQPLGHHQPGKGDGGTGRAALLLGVEDAMLMQELRFRGEEILERVNGFLGRAYFCEVKVSLPLGRSAPVRSREQAPPVGMADTTPPCAARGTFLSGMDSASPVARCYARFARLTRGAGEKAAGEHERNGEK